MGGRESASRQISGSALAAVGSLGMLVVVVVLVVVVLVVVAVGAVVAGAVVVVVVIGAVIAWLNSGCSGIVETWEESAPPQAVTINKIARPRCLQHI